MEITWVFCICVFLASWVEDITSDDQLSTVPSTNTTGCQFCPPGFKVEQQCTDITETTCAPCRPGETFSATTDNETVCKNCSECPEHALLHTKCNVTHDTECICEKGFYWDNENRMCHQCELCSHGWGVARQCSPTRNTVCRKCPPGTYSGLLSGTLGCELCTTCRGNQVMLQECTPIQDTICIDKDLHQRRLLPTDLPGQMSNKAVNYTQHNVIPVYCTILVAVLLGVLVFLVLRWRLHHTKTTHCKELAPGHSHEGSLDSSKRMLLAESDQSLKLIPVQSFPQTAMLKMKLKELSSEKQMELEASLNTKRQDGRDWVGLAQQLGYSKSSISVFEDLGNDKKGPAHEMLMDWSHSEYATIEVLIRALVGLGRMDVVTLLQPTCERVYSPLHPDCMV
ncbi:tumor necrosis factor receptor superfamily member 16-like [Limulus polyphemus]|uniref:Tumor necrosis factor receptor superfamily member 16-like n=1 Tax=Limulus polyphemus TaxID=6850 RepID=A0ABM1BZI5_LIMPO|nr:tumor necrosis factor receptor superfamily member 16-like [Limulus polyphemus]